MAELQSALQEVERLKDFREKQKDMVQAIVNQRDMYRTLLAQATPLPGDASLSVCEGNVTRGASGGRQRGEGQSGGSEGEEEMRRELEELKEQFEAYKKEKLKNDSMLQEQLDKMRDESSEIKIHNAKLGSKVHRPREYL